MNDKSNLLTDKVNVTIHTLSLSEKDISYAKVQRNTAYIGNIIDKILEHNKVMDRETLLYSAGLFRNGILELLKSGKAVDLLEMGVLYIKPDGSIDTSNPSIKDVPSMKLAFTPSELAQNAVKDVSVAADITEDKNPFITEIYDMFTRSGGNTVTSGHTIRLKGKKLKVAGSEAETGVFFAPCAEDESFSENISDWIQIPQNDLIENTASVLMFNLPQSVVAGKYKIIIRTAYGSGTRINKTVRTLIYENSITVI